MTLMGGARLAVRERKRRRGGRRLGRWARKGGGRNSQLDWAESGKEKGVEREEEREGLPAGPWGRKRKGEGGNGSG
jgi:hypothetical protein